MWLMSRRSGEKTNSNVLQKYLAGGLALVAMLILACGSLSLAMAGTAPTTSWATRYDGGLNGPETFDSAYSAILALMFPVVPTFKLMAVDSAGNVYVTGTTVTQAGFVDIETMKLRKGDGKVLWHMEYDLSSLSQFPAGIALDSGGNVLVAGVTITEDLKSDVVVIKYKGVSGEKIWDTVYKSESNHVAVATGMAVDSNNNVYVCGFTGYMDTSRPIPVYVYDYLTIKHSAGGAFNWATTNDGDSHLWDMATAIALDSKGKVYVTGVQSVSLSNKFDIATIKYTPAGKLVWKKKYDGPSGAADVGRAIAVDAQANVYVTGEATTGSGQAFLTMKYNNDPAQNAPVWANLYEDASNSLGRALVLDPKGNPCATGEVLPDISDDSSYDYLTIKYNKSSGDRVWAKTYTGPATDGWDSARAIAVDSVGNVYVTGSSPRVTGNSEDVDFATLKYAAKNGNKLWGVRYNNKPAKSWDGGVAVAIYGDTTVYVAGESTGITTDIDMLTIRYDQVQ
jgi:hypothetical protein